MRNMRKVERCKHGHLWTEENTYWQKKSNGKMYRQCRKCRARQMKDWQAKQPKKTPRVLSPQCNWGHDRSVYGKRIKSGDREVQICRACVHERQNLRAHGLTFADYSRILESQGGACAICKVDSPKPKFFFCVDHCHETGEVRGLLCSDCNLGIGNLKDDINNLKAAIRYLKTATLTLSKGKQ